jgi:pSer/pThr/pTyr-binding forkhead associated (FHA) protein
MKSSTHLICALSERAAREQTSTVCAPPSDFAPLRLVQQPGKIVLVLSQPKIVLGRHSLADVRLMLPYVSRKHCLFQYEGGKWRVSDLGSLNGIFVNREKVISVELAQGDAFSIGGLSFTVDMKSSTPLDDPERMVFQITDARPASSSGLTGQFRAA